MKAQITSLLLAAAALGISTVAPLSANSAGTTAIAYTVSKVYFRDSPTITPGSSRALVRASMGEPLRKITTDIWVYPRYHAIGLARADHDRCDTMVVTFTGQTVSDLKLVNQRAIKIYAASSRARATGLFASRP